MHRIEETVARGMCIGCGACSVASGGTIPVTLGSRRLYQADLSGIPYEAARAGSRVCPFSDESPNEDSLVARQAPLTAERHPLLGAYTSVSAGRVNDDQYLSGSSSGGLTSWLLCELIERGIVDAVINVGRPGPSSKELMGYGSTTDGSDARRRKSHYYAATMTDALSLAMTMNIRYALVGVPCFIKAARSLCVEKPILKDRLVVFVGLVCGHYKTQAWAESLGWQLGIPPAELADVDFRIKRAGLPSSDYLFGARASGDSSWRVAPTRELVGGNWGHNAFQPEACNFCDDVVAETADVSFGDAWLPEFTSESRGTNIVVSRDTTVDQIMQEGLRSGAITLFPLDPNDAVRSQAGGFRHRREGLSVRLADDIHAGLSVPRKRVSPDVNAVSRRRAELIRQRRRMAAGSHRAFEEACEMDDLDRFLSWMQSQTRRYARIESTLPRRFLRYLRHLSRTWLPVRRRP